MPTNMHACNSVPSVKWFCGVKLFCHVMFNANVANDALTVRLIDKSPEWIDTEWCVWFSYSLEKLCRSCSWVIERSCSVLHRLLVGASAGLSQDLSPLRLHVACQSLTSMTALPPKNVHQIRALATEGMPGVAWTKSLITISHGSLSLSFFLPLLDTKCDTYVSAFLLCTGDTVESSHYTSSCHHKALFGFCRKQFRYSLF